MSIAEREIESLREFIQSRPPREGESLSLEDYLCLWRAAQEREEAIEAIAEGIEDLNQGRVRPAADVMRDLRARLG